MLSLEDKLELDMERSAIREELAWHPLSQAVDYDDYDRIVALQARLAELDKALRALSSRFRTPDIGGLCA